MLRLSVAVCLTALSFAIVVAAVAPTQYLVNLTSEERIKYQSLHPDMVKLAKELKETHNNVTAVQGAKSILSHLGLSAKFGNKKSFKTAVKLFVSLDNIIDKCNSEGIHILSGNIAAIGGDATDVRNLHKALELKSRIHARHCYPQYKVAINGRRLEKISAADETRISKALDLIEARDFSCQREDGDGLLLSTDEVHFTGGCAEDALYKLVSNVAKQVMQTSQWEMLKSDSLASATHDEYEQMIAGIFNEYVFKPCSNYHAALDDILAQARFAYAILQPEDDQELETAMINNSLCASLLRDERKLGEPMMALWDKFAHSFSVGKY